MKKYFKKSLAVFMAMLMLLSVVGVSAFAASYKIEFLPGRYATGTGPDPIIAEKNAVITLPGASFTREGYVQTGWSTAASGSKKNYELNDSYTVTKAAKLYPYWEAVKCEVKFAPGEFGVGEEVLREVSEGETTFFPGAVFTRNDYIMIGWSSIDGGALEFALTDRTPTIMGNITFYPVWEKCVYDVEVDGTNMNFGNVCEDYITPAAQVVTITNVGNATINYTLPVNAGYNFTVVSGSLALEKGATLKISVQPKASLGVADYSGAITFDCNHDVADVVINTLFIVNAHSFDKYYSNNDATYEADGTKSAECSNGCGNIDTIIDAGSMKIYSVDNNTVDGLLKEYVYHKTVRATAYGSGMDNIQADGTIAAGTKRYRPVSWYVNDEFNGEFTGDNYDINFVHTSFGDYTLKIKYVEEVYACDNHGEPIFFCEECGELTGEKCEYCGADALAIVCDLCEDPTCQNVLFEDESEKTFGWVATGEEDEKSFDYYVGPSAKEEQEVIRPNTILSIIFGLFKELFALLFG